MRLAHLADIHIGYRKYARTNALGVNEREADVCAAFREACERVAFLRPDLVVIAGDLFHSVRPSNANISFVFRELKKLTTRIDAPIIVVAGNHESPKRTDTGSPLIILREIENVFVADSNLEWFTFPKLSLAVCAMPHLAIRSVNPHELRAKDSFKRNVLVSHLQTGENWLSDIGGEEKPLSALNIGEWDYVALGHVHSMRQVAYNVFYSGSTEHTSLNIWAESEQAKGFIEYDLEAKSWRFHELTSPREILILPSIDVSGRNVADTESEIIAALTSKTIKGKLVKLTVTGIDREILRALNYKSLRPFRAEALNLLIDFIPTGKTQRNLPAPVGRLEDELYKFCESDALRQLFRGYFDELSKEEEL